MHEIISDTYRNNNFYTLIRDIELFWNASKTKDNIFSQKIILYSPNKTGKSYILKRISEKFGIKYIEIFFQDNVMINNLLRDILTISDKHTILHIKFSELISTDTSYLEKLIYSLNNWFNTYKTKKQIILIVSTNKLYSHLFDICDDYLVYKYGCLSIEEKVNVIFEFLDEKEIKISKKTLIEIIKGYTQEAGIIQLLNCFKRLCGYCYANNKNIITQEIVTEILGLPRYMLTVNSNSYNMGVGLGWTQYGGKILLLDVIAAKGCGRVNIIGNIKKTMSDSIFLTHHVLLNFAEKLKLDIKKIEFTDLTVSIPELAENKDGASMGSAIFLKLYCLFSGKKLVKNIALTGEVTLNGNIIRVGGLKEKLAAAYANDIQIIILPVQSKHEIQTISSSLINKFQIFYVSNIFEIINILERKHYFC